MLPEGVDGLVVVITGAAGGQGAAACSLFLAHGARVIGVDRVAQSPISADPNLHYIQADLAAPSGIETVVEAVVRLSRGIVNVLYNNHSVLIGNSFMETSQDDFDQQVTTNFRSIYFLTQRVVSLMPRGSSIINIASANAILARPNMSVYSASKAALISLTRSLAVELGDRGIRVNCIAPGLIDTPMPRAFLGQHSGAPDWATVERAAIMKRAGHPEEVAAVALFLAGAGSSYMTGTVIPVDGGRTAT